MMDNITLLYMSTAFTKDWDHTTLLRYDKEAPAFATFKDVRVGGFQTSHIW